MDKWDYIRLLSVASTSYGDLLLQLMDHAGCHNLEAVSQDQVEAFCRDHAIRKRMAVAQAAGEEKAMENTGEIRAMRYIPEIAPHQIYVGSDDISLQSAVGGELGRLDLKNGCIMIYDADATKHNRPINYDATSLMRRTYPCSTSKIRGTVIVVGEETRTDPVDGSDINIYTHWDHGGRPPFDVRGRR